MTDSPELARSQIKGPAIGLIVTGAVGALAALWGLFQVARGADPDDLAQIPEEYREIFETMTSGAVAAAMNVVGLLVSGLLIWAGMQMKDLQSRTLAMTACILAMVPCVSPCCPLGLIFGIWGLVVLNKSNVREAFQG